MAQKSTFRSITVSLWLLALCAPVFAQFGSGTAKQVVTTSTTLPATCNDNPMQVYGDIGSSAGLYYCYPANTWNQVGGGGGTITGVTAGTGLSGGGTSGTVTLSLASPVTTGSFSCPTTDSASTCTISVAGVTATSKIFIQPSAAEGAILSVTCNPTSDTGLTAPRLASKTSGSFTINLGTYTTNPECFEYSFQ